MRYAIVDATPHEHTTDGTPQSTPSPTAWLNKRNLSSGCGLSMMNATNYKQATIRHDLILMHLLQPVMEITIQDESSLTLRGLQQYYKNVQENEKNLALTELLDGVDFNQVIIFVNTPERAKILSALLREC